MLKVVRSTDRQRDRQDLRFDLPAIGLKTIDSMKKVKASVLAVEAEYALFFDRDAVIRAADNAGIVIVGIEKNVSGDLSY